MRQYPEEDVATKDSGDHDPRLELIYTEALRGLVQQQGLVEGLGNHAGA
jgi:hypothetical protein